MVPSDSGLAHKVLQTSKDFLAFSDGQKINLRTGEVSAIKPEDYIDRTTGYPLPKNSDPNIRERIMDYLKTSLREEQVPYLLEESALSLHGSNIKERVLVVKGKEGGGKWVYGILFVKALRLESLITRLRSMILFCDFCGTAKSLFVVSSLSLKSLSLSQNYRKLCVRFSSSPIGINLEGKALVLHDLPILLMVELY